MFAPRPRISGQFVTKLKPTVATEKVGRGMGLVLPLPSDRPTVLMLSGGKVVSIADIPMVLMGFALYGLV